MNYILRIDPKNPYKERLEMAIVNLLPFVGAEAVYLSFNKSNKVTVVTFILKKETDKEEEILEELQEKVINIYPEFIFKFMDSDCAKKGFKNGKPYFVQHCTLNELIYFEPGAKVFYPREDTSKKLLKKAKKRFSLDMEAAVVSFRNVSVYSGKNKNEEAVFALYQTLRYIYICASEFFTAVFISNTCLFQQYDYIIKYAPSFKRILNKNRALHNEIVIMLNKAYSCAMQNTEMGDIDPELMIKAKTKVELMQKELNRLFLEYKALCKEKMQKLSRQECTGKYIFNEKIPSNYFVENALKSINDLMIVNSNIRCVYCFGYTILHNQENKPKKFSNKLPGYHFYLLIINLDQTQNEIAPMEELILEKFEGRHQVTILSHSAELIRKEKTCQKYFFDYVKTHGILIYNAPYYSVYLKKHLPSWEPEFKEKYEKEKVLKAKQLFNEAEYYLSDSHVTVKKVLFRRAIEQISSGLIYLHLGYFSNKLSMNSLFALLKYIKEIELPFDPENEKEAKILHYLFETAVVSINKEAQDCNNDYDKLIENRCILFLKHAKDQVAKEAGKLDFKELRYFS
ncbi:hypothetical protein [Flavobacterium sp. B183]|uniref:hypothetical protein n=1 Tax=Flavobacterium sp. B183 TaxID=907046 RepID=UPI00201F0E65|nr:hypothetical protein [Flavobacterium sp. B183]URC14577.1 hypothetical protein M4I44_09360 [Flavobacterium sp. B183]